MKNKNKTIIFILLCIAFLLLTLGYVLAVGTPVPSGQEKYPNPLKSMREGCEFKLYNADGTVRRTYPVKQGYLHTNHLTGQEQCYLLTRRGHGNKAAATTTTVVVTPTEPVCTTTTTYSCNQGTLNGQECKIVSEESPLCDRWYYSLNSGKTVCSAYGHAPRTPVCNNGLSFSIINHRGTCKGTITVPATKHEDTVCET